MPNPSAGPFWGPPTAHANFCEEDYIVSRYIAEFINTLSNFTYIFYGIYGLRKLRHTGIFDLSRCFPYWGLIAVGICSSAFHISLKYHTQMLDDLSMLFTTTPILHRVLTANATKKNTQRTGLLLGGLLLAFVIYHVKTDELIVHSSLFVSSILIIGIRTFQLIQLKTAEGSPARKQIWGVVRFGAFIFNVGFYIWLIDGWICDSLRDTRRMIGTPLAYLLELHGWWHIFTAVGAYIFIVVIDQLLSEESNIEIAESIAWPASWASKSIFAGRITDDGSANKKIS
ncbi:ceramidase [Penicillium angulare]|uniref:ceramidase n=1 Tax=Penicillium angulare TaxID=116970 RepID=UPI0025406A27|nr:ceramidase [Penicillium angulare]KAJ5280541.1 ceramidase [Penicillium angulare]